MRELKVRIPSKWAEKFSIHPKYFMDVQGYTFHREEHFSFDVEHVTLVYREDR